MVLSRLTDLELPPDVFAVVMATGIVSIAARGHAYPQIDIPLAAIAAAGFVLLAAGLVVRVLARPASAFGQVRDPDVALRLFTFVAACAVLGARFVAHPVVVWIAGAAAAAAWLILVPLAACDLWSRPPTELREHAHGAWLLVSVGTGGLAITGADKAIGSRWPGWVLLSVVAWILAILAYLAVTWLIAWRAVTAPFGPAQVTPDSWILMGALAIATLAGDHLLAAAHASGSGQWLADAARPAIMSLWVLSSLWIPVLLYAEVWRVDQYAGSLRFAGVWWSAVFPLGMYSAATQATALQLHMRSLSTISLVFFWIAFTVWLLVAVGALHTLARRRSAQRPASRS
ncbi:MAG: tellurite resistance/C4-dicarboxylate transporter family protein [Allobranchiibius sp.]